MSSQTTVVPIEEFIFNGLKSRLHEVFEAPVVMANSTDEIQALRKLRENKVNYPYLFLSITNFSETKDSYRGMPLLRRGVDVLLSHDSKIAKKISILPVDFVFEVNYRHNNFPQVIEFGKNWLFAARAGYLKFTVEYGKAFDIHIVLSEDLQIPKREANPENITEYQLSTTLTVRGYMSSKKLREQQVAIQVDTELFLRQLGEKEGVQIMKFKSKWSGAPIEQSEET